MDLNEKEIKLKPNKIYRIKSGYQVPSHTQNNLFPHLISDYIPFLQFRFFLSKTYMNKCSTQFLIIFGIFKIFI